VSSDGGNDRDKRSLKNVILGLRKFYSDIWSHARSRQWLISILRIPLYANSAHLITHSGIIAISGFAFWVIAARFYPVENVGFGSALISAVMLLSFVANLGLGLGLIRFLPTSGPKMSNLINSCFTLSGAIAVVAALIFLGGLKLWSPALVFVYGNYILLAAFVIAVISKTIYELSAEVFVALRRAGFIPILSTVNGLGKLVLVIVFASYLGTSGIFGSFTLAMVLAIITGLLLFLPRVIKGYRPVPRLPAKGIRDMFRYSFANYVGTVFWQTPNWLLPLIIVNVLGAEDTAYFYISWSIATVLYAIPNSISMSLFAEGSRGDRQLRNHVIGSLKMLALVLLPAVVIIALGGGILLLLLGGEYSQSGGKILWVLAPSAIPLAANLVYIGIARVRKQLRNLILLPALTTVGTLLLSFLLIPVLGIHGPGIGWLVSQLAAAFITVPKLVRFLKADKVDNMMEADGI